MRIKICYILGLTLVFIFGLWSLKTNTLVESYDNLGEDLGPDDLGEDLGDDLGQDLGEESMRYLERNAHRKKDVETISYYDKNALDNIVGDYDITSISTDLLNNNPNKQIAWSKVNVSKSQKNVLQITQRPKTDFLISDTCSTKSFLNSNFKEDICVKYAGDNATIEKKCKELSADNCKIPRCCVLLNGTSCVGGNAFGPTFITQDGKSVDYDYYYNKNKCYGDCEKELKNIEIL